MFQARNTPNHAPDRKAMQRDYGQSAITSFVTCTLLQPATAWERFTEHGPLALLPAMQNGEIGYALVWCCRPADADALIRLDDLSFLDRLHAEFGDRVGDFVTVGPRNVYPLTLKAVAATARGREFAIGNAAQTLHPVAGQGLNLGLRDAFVLASALRENFDDPEQCARSFRAARRLDRAATIRLTDFLPRIFSSRWAPVAAARGAALASLDLIAPLRHVLARQMMNGRR
jgi:2-octaprenyl-6-methoxyphenol hydroxylase